MGKKIIKVVTNFLMVFIRNNFLNLNSFDMDTQIRLWKTTVEILKNGNSVKNEKVISSQMTYGRFLDCLLYTSPSPRDQRGSRMPSSA